MAEASTNTTERIDKLKVLVIQAAGIVAGSQNTVGISQAMELVGFTVEERKTMKYYQQVRRKSTKLSVIEVGKGTTPLPRVEVQPSVDTVSTLTASTARNNNPNPSPSQNEDGTISSDSSVRWCLQLGVGTPSAESQEECVEESTFAGEEEQKKRRQTPKETQRFNAVKCAQKNRNRTAMKLATNLIKESLLLNQKDPKKKTINVIVKETNKRCDSNFHPKTVARYVREGRIG
jgi:hypothetical protein